MDDDRSTSSVIGGAGGGPPSTAGGTAPRILPKRSRAALACNACRKVKSKCDGARPSCTRCSRQNTECVYTLNVHDRRMDRQEERRAHLALKHKVNELEAKLAAKSGGGGVGGGGAGATPDDDTDDASPAQASNTGLSDAGSRGTNAGSAVDALATGAFDHRPAAEIGYFGPTSNHAIFRAVTTAMVNSGYRLTVLRQQEEEDSIGGSGSSTNLGVNANRRDDHHYPSPTMARQWVTLFFDTVGAMLPYVSETSLLKEIDAAASAGSLDRLAPRSRSTEGLLNVVFAHALVAAGKEDVAEPFYHRAVALLLLEEQAVSTPTMHTVQSLLLLGSFQQNSQRAMASLATHSLAVKASYQLGLHSPSTYEGLSTTDKELRAKLWFAVVNQDMILGTGLGRPCLIPPAYVQYRMLDSVAPPPTAMTTVLSTESESLFYYRHLSALHAIMGVAVETVYGANIGTTSAFFGDSTEDNDSVDGTPRALVAKTMDLLFRLQKWQTEIRPFGILTSVQAERFSVWTAATFQAERYSIALSVYYYKTVMLVCAPLLMRVLELVTDAGTTASGGAAPATAAATRGGAAASAGVGTAGDTPASFNSMLLEMAAPVLKKELHAIGEYQKIAHGLLRHQPSFFKSNAIWWVCNFNSLTMSLHLFALWLVCILSESMSTALGSSMAGVEAHLLEAIEILRGVGGTSMMSVKAFHSLKRYMRLARAIAPSGHAAAAGSAPPINFDELLGQHHTSVPHPQQQTHQQTQSHAPQQQHQPHPQHNAFDPSQPHSTTDPGSLFSSGAFLWDGFPDAGMNYVGDLFYQQLEGDFLGDSSIGGLPGGFDMQLDRVP
ncbi:hypothetical protein Sste5346_003364 [Sporothrix stenoceras]|uniref:Zn(2)-C6 fungal-type domain-containing protein n=1 Tax=Sporothrix stenoceras TaxID=5173 RepID=A0ABR3ZCP3_9PEZI